MSKDGKNYLEGFGTYVQKILKKEDVNMKSKKWLWCMLLMCCIIFVGTKVDAASAKSKALEKYRSIMVGKSSYTNFAVVYLDNDKIPELITSGSYGSSGYVIITYKNGKLLTRESRNKPYCYWKKRGFFSILDARSSYYAGYGWEETKYYKMKKNSNELVAYFHLHKDYNDGSRVVKYYSKGSEISKGSFDSVILKYKKNTKGREIKYYTNTLSNRKKYLS